MKNELASKSVDRRHKATFVNSNDKFSESKQRTIYEIMKEWSEVNSKYLGELKLFEANRDRIHKYSNRIDFVCESLGTMPAVDPKVSSYITILGNRESIWV